MPAENAKPKAGGAALNGVLPGETLKAKLRNRERVVVANIDHPSASLVESLGPLGIDAVFFDCEQGSPDIETVEDMARAARLVRLPSLVRLWSREDWMIERMLFRGVDGIVAPRVDDQETAAGIVKAVEYCYPRGDQKKVVVVQIESARAVENLDAILAVEGIDAFFVGPVDLSKSLGYRGSWDGPEMQRVIREVLDRIHTAGKASGMLVNEHTLDAAKQQGISFLYCHVNDFIRVGVRAFANQQA